MQSSDQAKIFKFKLKIVQFVHVDLNCFQNKVRVFLFLYDILCVHTNEDVFERLLQSQNCLFLLVIETLHLDLLRWFQNVVPLYSPKSSLKIEFWLALACT